MQRALGNRPRDKQRKSHWPKGYCPIPPEKRIQKGEHRNPNAGNAPRQYQTINSLLRKLGTEICPEEQIKEIRKIFPDFQPREGMTIQEATIARVWLEAARGMSWAQEFTAERTEGKVPNTLYAGNAPKQQSVLTDKQKAELVKQLNIKIVSKVPNAPAT
jgi:hypothetical protein